MDPSIRDTIARVAQEEGIDPSYALAVAERESSFNPNAHASKTIYGLFQMNGGERAKYGAGNSADPETQTRAFAGYTRDLQAEMSRQLGRAPTNNETYLGHFWGGPRASRTISGAQAGLSPQDMFTRRELAENPELARGSSAGGLASNIMGDIGRRQAKYGGDQGNNPDSGNFRQNPSDFSRFGQPMDGAAGAQVASNETNFAQFGRAQDEGSSPPTPDKPKQTPQSPGSEIDLSQYGVAANTIRPPMPPQPGQPAPPAQIIDDYNATADFKNRPLPPQEQDLNKQNENNLVPPPPAARSASSPNTPPDFSQFGTPPADITANAQV